MILEVEMIHPELIAHKQRCLVDAGPGRGPGHKARRAGQRADKNTSLGNAVYPGSGIISVDSQFTSVFIAAFRP